MKIKKTFLFVALFLSFLTEVYGQSVPSIPQNITPPGVREAIRAASQGPRLKGLLGTVPDSLKNKRVSFTTGISEGIEVPIILRSIAEAAGLSFVHLPLPDRKANATIKGRPFGEAWPAAVYGLLGPEYDFAFVGSTVLVGKREDLGNLLKSMEQVTTPTAEEVFVQEVVPSPAPKAVAEVLKSFFGVEAAPLEQGIVIRVPAPAMPIVLGFIHKLNAYAAPDRPAPEQTAIKLYAGDPETLKTLARALGFSAIPIKEGALIFAQDEESFKRLDDLLNQGKGGKRLAFINVPAPIGEETKALAQSLGLEVYAFPTGIAVLYQEESRLKTFRDLIEAAYPRRTEERAQEPQPPAPVLKVYPVPKNLPVEPLQELYGKNLYLDRESGLLFAVLTPERHENLVKDLEEITNAATQVQSTAKNQDPPLPTRFGETTLTYTTHLPPSRLKEVLSGLFPTVSLIPVDERKLLIVKARPEEHIELARALKKLDGPTAEELERQEKEKQLEAEKAKTEQVWVSYKSRFLPVETLKTALSEIFKPASQNAQGGKGDQEGALGDQTSSTKSPSLLISAVEAANSLIVQGPRVEVEKALKVLEEVDRHPEQARVRVTIYQIQANNARNLGLDWQYGESNAPGLNVSFVGGGLGINYALSNLLAQLALLEEKGEARKLVDSAALAYQGQPIELLSGGKIILVQQSTPGNPGPSGSSSTQEYEFGLSFKATPYILGDGSVLLPLTVEIGDLPVSGPIPNSIQIAKSSVKASIRVGSGQTAVLGGVLGVEKTNNRKGIPILMDLPLIGGLFSTDEVGERQQALLILVTPEIIPDEVLGKKKEAPVRGVEQSIPPWAVPQVPSDLQRVPLSR